MIITLSIAATALVSWLSYQMLFYDASDFWDGFRKLAGCLFRHRHKWIWEQPQPPPPPEHFEDEGWSAGIRFLLFLALSGGAGYLAYYELHKHFGGG